LLVVIAVLLGGCATTTGGPVPTANDRIQFIEHNGFYGSVMPVSKLTMIFPKGGWAQKDNNIGGGTSSPRYFYFEDKTNSYIMSGWFEPDRLFTSVKKLWEAESAKQQKGGLPAAVNVTYEQFNGWNTVMYDYVVAGIGTSSHIRGHWVQSGTWIDLHISTTTNKSAAENRKKLKALLKGFGVVSGQNG
jgi:hypothetical protein